MDREVSSDEIQQYLETFHHQQQEIDDEEEEEDDSMGSQSILSFVVGRLKAFYVDNIPVEIVKELPKSGKYILGGICYAISVAIFLYFTIENFDNLIHQKFISLEIDSGDCHSVPISISESFYTDAFGNWPSSEKFYPFTIDLHFKFSNFIAENVAAYQTMMNVYYHSLNETHDIISQQNLGLNVIMWLSYARYYIPDDPTATDFTNAFHGDIQYVEYSADHSVIFGSRYSGAVISSSEGICDHVIYTNFNPVNSMFLGRIVTSNTSSYGCYGVFNTFSTHPYSALTVNKPQIELTPDYLLNLDMRSFTTALAVNLGYVSLKTLLRTSSDEIDYDEYEGQQFLSYEYHDARFPYMNPIYCTHNITQLPSSLLPLRTLCFLRAGTTIALPIINHMGNSYSEPSYCECDGTLYADEDQCNQFLLMSSLLIFPMNFTNLLQHEIEAKTKRIAFELQSHMGIIKL